MLETERLRLGTVRQQDMSFLHALSHLEAVRRWMSPALPQQLEALWHRLLAKEGCDALHLPRVITDKAQARPVGVIAFQHYAAAHHAQIVFALHPDHWHRGYMQEALACMITYGFASGLRRISAYCALENTASIHVLERAGFGLEGTLRHHARLADGRRHDVRLYSLNEEEWRSRHEKRTGGQV